MHVFHIHSQGVSLYVPRFIELALYLALNIYTLVLNVLTRRPFVGNGILRWKNYLFVLLMKFGIFLVVWLAHFGNSLCLYRSNTVFMLVSAFLYYRHTHSRSSHNPLLYINCAVTDSFLNSTCLCTLHLFCMITDPVNSVYWEELDQRWVD